MSTVNKTDKLDRLIRKIHEEMNCQELVQQVNILRVQMKKAEKYINLVIN